MCFPRPGLTGPVMTISPAHLTHAVAHYMVRSYDRLLGSPGEAGGQPPWHRTRHPLSATITLKLYEVRNLNNTKWIIAFQKQSTNVRLKYISRQSFNSVPLHKAQTSFSAIENFYIGWLSKYVISTWKWMYIKNNIWLPWILVSRNHWQFTTRVTKIVIRGKPSIILFFTSS